MTLGGYLTITGLVMDMIGVGWIILYGPEQLINPAGECSFPPMERVNEYRKTRARRKKYQKLFGVIIVVGFALQALGESLG